MSNTDDIKRIVSISKEQLALLPAAQFEGKIHIVDSAEGIPPALECLRKSEVIGFDTETRPSFRKGQTYLVSLLQLSTREDCFLFRLNRIGLTGDIIDLLEDPGKLKIGLSIHDDFHNLMKLSGLNPSGFIDLQQYVKDFKIVDNSLTRIHGILFNERISKNQRLTNWEAEELTPSQQSYASLDAFACIRIYDFLSSGVFVPERSAYYLEIEPEEPEMIGEPDINDTKITTGELTEKKSKSIGKGVIEEKNSKPRRKTQGKENKPKSAKKTESTEKKSRSSKKTVTGGTRRKLDKKGVVKINSNKKDEKNEGTEI